MTEVELIEWLRRQHSTLDKIIADAGKEFHKDALQRRSKEQFGFDLAECQFESYNLIRNKDLCYDRPNTAFGYSLWYHGRRVNTFLSYFAKTILNTTDKQIEIFDLGAGTGAVQWAVGLVYHKMKEEGRQMPKIKIVNVDTSPFMLYYSKDYLWKHFVAQYKHCQDFSGDIEYEINSWSNSKNVSITNPWITASYLFDISDTSSNGQPNTEYKNAVKSGFKELIKAFNPSTILLLTSDQPPKRILMNELKGEFAASGYNQQEVSVTQLLLNGQLVETSSFRKQLYQTYLPYLQTTEAQAIGRTAEWKDYSFVGTILSKQQTTLNLIAGEPKKKAKEIKLYNPPITIRRDIVLNEDQRKASEHTERPTIISGPAGCGKSVVITERIKNLIEAKQYNPELRILVTTFNKQLMSYLGKWIEDLLNKEKVERIGNNFKFKNSGTINISLMHFDILPTRIGNANGSLVFNNTLRAIATEAIASVKEENKITTNKHDKVLNPDYVIEEYHRIVYGLQYVTEKDFLTSERKGRPKLKKEGDNRKLLWKAVWKFLDILEKKNIESIVLRRHKFLRQLQQKQIKTKFTHIFVDEFQDCTQADYQIFDLLLDNPNNIVLAGDIAQAIQIGNVADIPRIRTEEMYNRKTHLLKGSYRLPFRISECITRISEIIQNGSVITPYKGSPPGARPIVIYAGTPNELKSKIESVYKAYNVYGLDRVTILESDWDICKAMRAVNIACETDTILRLKGLEKTCVLWSTRQDIEYKDEVAEFVYTILSRTSGILLIVLTTQTLKKYYKIINLFRKDRLILWDTETKNNFEFFCNDTQDNEATDDDE
jgi:DNA helicase II / ATP-dependent DNA helicase PcrA